MAFGTTPTDNQENPVGSVYVKDTVNGNFTALQGGPASTDTENNSSAPASLYVYDGNDETQGAKADTAWGLSGASSVIAALKKIALLLSGFGLDNTNILKTSLYAKFSAPGDTALSTDANGYLINRGGWSEQSGLSAAGGNADLVPATDVTGYKSFSIQIGGTYSGTLTFQGSNDGVVFRSIAVNQMDAPGTIVTTTTSTNVTYYCSFLTYRYLRIRMTSYASGTATGVLELYTYPIASNGVSAAQSGTWTMQPGNTVNTSPWLTTTANNNKNIAANTTTDTVIKGSNGYLVCAVVISTGTAGLTFYDNATVGSGTPLLAIPANAPVGSIYTIPGRALNGITAGGAANCPSVTCYFN
jgi:hypothetical protein